MRKVWNETIQYIRSKNLRLSDPELLTQLSDIMRRDQDLRRRIDADVEEARREIYAKYKQEIDDLDNEFSAMVRLSV